MTESVKRTSSRDETEMVGVQGITEAGAFSHHPRKKNRKAKDVEGSSDQSQEGGQKAEVITPTYDQTKKRGPKTKLPPGEREARKKARDRNRYKNMKDAAQETREIKAELETLKNEKLGKLTQDMKTMKDDIEIVKNDKKKMISMGSLMNKFLQRELTEDDWKNIKFPWENDSLEGQENLKTDSEYPLELFDLVGMSRQEILPELEKIRDSFEELKRENDRRYEELKSENKELKRENKRLNSRITAIETLKNK